MDFPKSVPSVGLVDGKFVDENTASGTPGSLIPAAWGNAVTQEILNVIDRAGLVPAEGDNSQLAEAIVEMITGGLAGSATEEVAGIAKIATDADFKAAVADDSKMVTVAKIKTWFSTVMRQATETASGWAKVATQSATNSGVDDTTFITPKKFSAGLAVLVVQATETVMGISKIASQSVVDAGVSDSTVVTPRTLAARLAALKAQYSPEYTITPGSQTVITHSMGADATVDFIFICKVAQAGYSVGDAFEWKDYQFNSTSTGSSVGPYIHSRAAGSVTMATGNSTGWWLPHKSTGAITVITLANWSLQARIKA